MHGVIFFANETSLRPLFYFVLPSPTQRMSKYIKEIGVDDKHGCTFFCGNAFRKRSGS